MAPNIKRKEALTIIVLYMVSQSVAVITRRVNEEIPSSILSTPGCNGKIKQNNTNASTYPDKSLYMEAKQRKIRFKI